MFHNGDPKFGFALTSSGSPEKFAVVFQCEDHDAKFIIQKNQTKTKELWERLKKGQEVTITYREVHEVTEHGTLNGPKTFVSKKLKKYDFLDAK